MRNAEGFPCTKSGSKRYFLQESRRTDFESARSASPTTSLLLCTRREPIRSFQYAVRDFIPTTGFTQNNKKDRFLGDLNAHVCLLSSCGFAIHSYAYN